MTRYRVTLEYDGTDFVGWQRQANGPSIQAALEEAIHAFCGEQVQVFGAGRTDAGVHALGQAVHFDLAEPHPADTVCQAVNFHLKPAPIVVLEAREAAPDFHARFSATARHYLYRILNRRPPSALAAGRVWHVPARLNARAMQRAAQHLVGRHDFTTFRSAHCQADSPIRTLDTLDVRRRHEDIHITATARSFLHNQVRALVGTLKRVGEGAMTAEDVAAALAACDRRSAGPTAPAHGLYLAAVDYPDG